MNKTIAITLAALMLAAAIPSVDARVHGGRYITGAMGGVAPLGFWCSEDQHNVAPIGDPDDYSSPTNWLFSGEPECAQNDALNAVGGALGEEPQEGGLGAFGWIVYPEEFGSLVVANTDDDFFGLGQSYFMLWVEHESGAEPSTSAGCGPQSFILPFDIDPAGQSPTGSPVYLFWAFVDAVNLTDDLTVCFASTGTITADIG